MWGQPSSNVLHYQQQNAMPEYFWYDQPLKGMYQLCKGRKNVYDFCIVEVDTYFVNMSEGEKQAQFGEAIFACGGNYAGTEYKWQPMDAETLEEAKQSLENWYENMLSNTLSNLKNAIECISAEYVAFLAAKRR